MKALLYVFFGVLLALGGHAVAEQISGFDEHGNYHFGSVNPDGSYTLFGSDGSTTFGQIQRPPRTRQNPC